MKRWPTHSKGKQQKQEKSYGINTIFVIKHIKVKNEHYLFLQNTYLHKKTFKIQESGYLYRRN